eukprot:1288160-Amphidinium_carterae.1
MQEHQTMQKFLEREEQRVKYFDERLVALADLKATVSSNRASSSTLKPEYSPNRNDYITV